MQEDLTNIFKDAKDANPNFSLISKMLESGRFYKVDVLKRNIFCNDLENHNDYAIFFFKKLVEKLSAITYSKFPDFQSKDSKIEKLIEINIDYFNNLFIDAFNFYWNFGFCLILFDEITFLPYLAKTKSLQINVEKQAFCLDLDVDEGIAKKVGSKNTLIKMGFYQGNSYYLNNAVPELIGKSVNNYENCLLFKNESIFNLTFQELSNIDQLWYRYRHAVGCLRNIIVTGQGNQQNFGKDILSNDFSILQVPQAPLSDLPLFALNGVNNGSDSKVSDLYEWLSNKGLLENIAIFKEELKYNEDIILSKLGLENFFIDVNDENQNETRVAANDRVNNKNLILGKLQSVINDFVQRIVRYWVSLVLKKPIEDIDLTLSLDSISILAQEQKMQEDIANFQQLNGVIQQINALKVQPDTKPSLLGIYFEAGKFILSSAKIDGVKEAFLSWEKTIMQSFATPPSQQDLQQQQIQQAMQRQQLQLQSQQISSNIYKNQAQASLYQAQANKASVEAQVLPQEIAEKENAVINQAQQQARLEEEDLRKAGVANNGNSTTTN